MVLLIIIPLLNGYFIGNINPLDHVGRATCTAQVCGHLCLASLEGAGDSMASNLSEIDGIYGNMIW